MLEKCAVEQTSLDYAARFLFVNLISSYVITDARCARHCPSRHVWHAIITLKYVCDALLGFERNINWRGETGVYSSRYIVLRSICRIYTLVFTREALYNIWTRDWRSGTPLTYLSTLEWESPRTAMVKRSRYICFFFHLARRIYRCACIYAILYIYSTGRRCGHFLARDDLTVVGDRGGYIIRAGSDTVTPRPVKQSILFLRMTVVALCWHSISEVTGFSLS